MILLQGKMPVTVRQIAGQLEITPRMMRSSLEVISAWLGERGARLVRKPNYGVSIEAAPSIKEQLIRELSSQKNYLPFLSQAERMDLLICMLLRHTGDPLQAEQLENTMGISHPTFLKDMNKVTAWLQGYGLELAHKSRGGFQVAGPEASWREAVVDFLITHFGVVPLLVMGMGSGNRSDLHNSSNLKTLNAMLVEMLQTLDLTYAYGLVKRLEQSSSCKFTDVSFASLLCHLALGVSRISQGKVLQSTLDFSPCLIKGQQSSAVRKIAQEIFSERQVLLNELEVDFLCRQILGAKIQHSIADLSVYHRSQEDQPGIGEIVDSIVDEASLYLHPSLKVDQQLIRALTYHIQVAANRLRYHLPIHNPLLEDILAQYPYIFRIARKSMALLQERIQVPIPDDEVAYIAMHLGAAMERLRPIQGVKRKVWIVCGEGVATAWLLISRLQAEFSELEIVEVTSALEITLQPPAPGQVDAVITTVPVEIPGILTIPSSPLLNQVDKARIREALEIGLSKRVQIQPVEEDEGPSLSSLITAKTIQLGVSAASWEEVVEIAGGLLRDMHAIHGRYIEAMKKAIWQYGPYVVFAPGTALLHARPEDGVTQVCMSLVTLKPPVPFGHPQHDPVYLAIGLGVVDEHSHLRALAQLARLLSSPPELEKLKTLTTIEGVLNILSQAA